MTPVPAADLAVASPTGPVSVGTTPVGTSVGTTPVGTSVGLGGLDGVRREEPRRATLQTEFAFELPRGFVSGDGDVHRSGVMRLATARDELVPLRDIRVQENPAYLSVVLLARVITQLGSLPAVHDGVVENMFAADLAFLQDFYRQINAEGHTRAAVTCPHCAQPFEVELGGSRLGES